MSFSGESWAFSFFQFPAFRKDGDKLRLHQTPALPHTATMNQESQLRSFAASAVELLSSRSRHFDKSAEDEAPKFDPSGKARGKLEFSTRRSRTCYFCFVLVASLSYS